MGWCWGLKKSTSLVSSYVSVSLSVSVLPSVFFHALYFFRSRIFLITPNLGWTHHFLSIFDCLGCIVIILFRTRPRRSFSWDCCPSRRASVTFHPQVPINLVWYLYFIIVIFILFLIFRGNILQVDQIMISLSKTSVHFLDLCVLLAWFVLSLVRTP